jgi:hypothetical protein
MNPINRSVITVVSVPTWSIDPEDQYQVMRRSNVYVNVLMSKSAVENLTIDDLKQMVLKGEADDFGDFAGGHIKFFTSNNQLAKAIEVSSSKIIDGQLVFSKEPIHVSVDEISCGKYEKLALSYRTDAKEASLNDSYVTSNEYYETSHFYAQLSMASQVYETLVPNLLGNLGVVFSLIKGKINYESDYDEDWSPCNEGDILKSMIFEARMKFDMEDFD